MSLAIWYLSMFGYLKAYITYMNWLIFIGSPTPKPTMRVANPHLHFYRAVMDYA